MLRTWFAFGVFDRAAYTDDDARIDKPAHAYTDQAIEEQALTPLQNAGDVLPLVTARATRIAAIGSAAEVHQFSGGSSHIHPHASAAPVKVIFAPRRATPTRVIDRRR